MSSPLFEPIRFRDVTLRNRIAVSPMCTYSCEDGIPNDWHLVHLGARALGGAGLVIAEATSVEPIGRITPHDTGLWNDAQAEAWIPVTRFIKQYGSVAAVQLAHAGRKAGSARPWQDDSPSPTRPGAWETVGPSPFAFNEKMRAPRELSTTDIQGLVRAFRDAAVRSLHAGFEIVEIHAAHGYLLHQFLSPLSNLRNDSYGGSFANRTRLVREVTSAIREIWPDHLPLFLRISATDWVEGGWDIEQTVELSRQLKDLGVDLIDCSSGGAVPNATMTIEPGYQVPLAARVRREAGIASGAVGLITEPKQAEAIIAQGEADLVLLAREFLRDPHWPYRAAKELGVEIKAPFQYERAW